MAKNHMGLQAKSTIPSKPTKSTGVKKSTIPSKSSGNVKSTKPSEKAPTKDPTNKPHQTEVPAVDKSQPNMENFMKEDEQVHNMENEKRKPKDKLTEVSAKQNKAMIIPRKVQPYEIPRKIYASMSTRNANANRLSRSKKHSAENNMLKNLEQRLRSNICISKITEEQSHDHKMVKDEKTRINMNVDEQVKNQIVIPNTSIAEECQIQDQQKTPTPDSHSDNIALTFGKASDCFWTVEHHHALEDEQELKQRDQTIGNNVKVECRELNTRHEQLTEPEKELKEIIIKSQTLLSTADTLFKLNIPVSFLHIASEQEDARNKFYGGDASNDVATRLHKMMESDIYQRDVDVNSMWEFEWSNIRSLLGEEKMLCGVMGAQWLG